MRGEYWNPELETRPWAEVEVWQSGRIAEMLPALHRNSPMYAELHKGVSVVAAFARFDDLCALPFTTKEDLRKALEAGTDAEPFGTNQSAATGDVIQCISSSGTTGSPVYYPLTRDDVDMFADAIANTWFTAGVRRDDIVAHLVGLPMVAGGLPYADGFRRLGATLCWLGGFPTERILTEMRRLRATALLATTSFGLYLADRWEQAGRGCDIPSRLRKVLVGGEPGLGQPEIRERMSAGLGITHLRDTMGLGDVISGMWSECEAQEGMHFNAQRHVAIELIDAATLERIRWREGAEGELVYTAFAREAAPVVRYRSRDHVSVVATRCVCGRTSPRIRCIGRTDDMLIYKGMNVFPTSIRACILEVFAKDVEPMMRVWKEYANQVRFDEPIAVDVEASPSLDLGHTDNLAREIEQHVRERLQVRIAVRVVDPGDLEKSVYKNAMLAVRGADSKAGVSEQ